MTLRGRRFVRLRRSWARRLRWCESGCVGLIEGWRKPGLPTDKWERLNRPRCRWGPMSSDSFGGTRFAVDLRPRGVDGRERQDRLPGRNTPNGLTPGQMGRAGDSTRVSLVEAGEYQQKPFDPSVFSLNTKGARGECSVQYCPRPAGTMFVRPGRLPGSGDEPLARCSEHAAGFHGGLGPSAR